VSGRAGTADAVSRPAPDRPNRGSVGSHTRWAGWLFAAPVVIYLVTFYAYPLYRNIDLSIRDYTVRSFVRGDAPYTGFANYRKVLADPQFVPAIVHTLLFTGVSIAAQFSIGMVLAVFFRQNFRLSTTLRALFLVPWLLPLIVSASTWSWMLNSDSGIVNAALHLVGISSVNWLTSPSWSLWSVTIANIWIGIPFNLVVLYSGLQTIPANLYEAAALDGASNWQTFWRVTFPLLRPVSAITILLGLIYTLKVFDIIWIMTKGGPAGSSTTLATWSYQLGFGNLLPAFSPGAAVGNLLIILALVCGFGYIRTQRKQAKS
jgi:multiple sugar transport system permease protein